MVTTLAEQLSAAHRIQLPASSIKMLDMTRFCLAPVLAACALLPHEFPLFISVHKLRWFTRISQLTAVEVLYVAFFWALALDSHPTSMCVVNFHVVGQCVVLKVRSMS